MKNHFIPHCFICVIVETEHRLSHLSPLILDDSMSSHQGSAPMSGTMPTPATPARTWWRTTSPSSTASGLASAPWCSKVGHLTKGSDRRNLTTTTTTTTRFPITAPNLPPHFSCFLSLTSSALSVPRLLRQTLTCHQRHSLSPPTRCLKTEGCVPGQLVSGCQLGWKTWTPSLPRLVTWLCLDPLKSLPEPSGQKRGLRENKSLTNTSCQRLVTPCPQPKPVALTHYLTVSLSQSLTGSLH